MQGSIVKFKQRKVRYGVTLLIIIRIKPTDILLFHGLIVVPVDKALSVDLLLLFLLDHLDLLVEVLNGVPLLFGPLLAFDLKVLLNPAPLRPFVFVFQMHLRILITQTLDVPLRLLLLLLTQILVIRVAKVERLLLLLLLVRLLLVLGVATHPLRLVLRRTILVLLLLVLLLLWWLRVLVLLILLLLLWVAAHLVIVVIATPLLHLLFEGLRVREPTLEVRFPVLHLLLLWLLLLLLLLLLWAIVPVLILLLLERWILVLLIVLHPSVLILVQERRHHWKAWQNHLLSRFLTHLHWRRVT